MRIAGLQKLTLLDFPGKAAATVFTPGCNLRCPFCHNAPLVISSSGQFPAIDESEVFSLLAKRQGLLDGVCITGGEPLLQPDIVAFCARIKQAGFAVKLDTNGTFPDRLRSLVAQGLVDYVAMDVKNCRSRYADTVGIPGLDLAPIEESIGFLLCGSVSFEFRTTVMRELHSPNDLEELAQWLAPADAWYLQSFKDSDGVIAGKGAYTSYTEDELSELCEQLRAIAPGVRLRPT